VRALSLGSPLLTALFWGTAGVFAAAWWLTPFPPAIDYPQHLLLGVLLKRWLDPSSVEHATYVVQPLTYNGLFHVLVAALSFVVAPEVAGKLLLSLIPLLTAGAALAVVRWSKRPLWYAFLALPLGYSYTVGWGFANYSIVAPLSILTVVAWLRWRDGEKRYLPIVTVTSLVVAYGHVLATLGMCLCVALLCLTSRPPREVGIRAWARNLIVWPLPFAPAALYCVSVFLVHRHAPHIYWEPEREGLDVPAWSKLTNVANFAVDNLVGSVEETWFHAVLALLILTFVASAFLPSTEPRAPREVRWLAATSFLAYLLVPRVAMSTWWIFERLSLFWLIYAAGAAPALPALWNRWLGPFAGAVSLAGALHTAQAFAAIPDARDASAAVDALPASARAIAVIHSPSGAPAVHRELWVHVLAYHVVRRSGEVAFDFTRYASLPVRRRDAGVPPLFPAPLEWYPGHFDPNAVYAHHFDHVLVRTPDTAPNANPRALVFRDAVSEYTELAHHGRFWVFRREAARAGNAPP
jgi:hypothetical protein